MMKIPCFHLSNIALCQEVAYNHFLYKNILQEVKMKKNYLKKLLKYMKKVYHIAHAIKHLKDRRIKPKYSAAEDILPVLFGFLIRIQSFNELKFRLKVYGKPYVLI